MAEHDCTRHGCPVDHLAVDDGLNYRDRVHYVDPDGGPFLDNLTALEHHLHDLVDAYGLPWHPRPTTYRGCAAGVAAVVCRAAMESARDLFRYRVTDGVASRLHHRIYGRHHDRQR